MEFEVLDKTGASTGRKVSLPESVFGIEPNDHAIYLDVKQYLANRRQGTHATKGRSFVTGSTRKLKKQKGTGTARAGDIKSPLFRGGGRMFGPQPRDYSFKLNKKTKQLARKSALTYKAKQAEIAVLENLSFEKPRTKDIMAVLKGLQSTDKKVLIVLGEADSNVYLSSRNLPHTKVVLADSLNTYDILDNDQLILFENSIEKISKF